jgi:hypothetical protein
MDAESVTTAASTGGEAEGSWVRTALVGDGRYTGILDAELEASLNFMEDLEAGDAGFDDSCDEGCSNGARLLMGDGMPLVTASAECFMSDIIASWPGEAFSSSTTHLRLQSKLLP